MRQKGIAHLFLLVFVVIIGIGAIGYLAYQNVKQEKVVDNTLNTAETTKDTTTPHPTSTDWKTFTKSFRNEKYSFKYPPHWIVRAPYTSDDVIIECDTCMKEENVDRVRLKTIINLSIDDYFEKHSQIAEDIEKTTFKGLEAVKSISGGGPEGIFVSIFFIHNEQRYEFDYHYRDSGHLEVKTFEDFPKPVPDILSTLEFEN